jgi:hypothetical protein
MAFLTTAERTAILAQITTKTEQLEEANETLRKLLKKQVSEYRFDDNEGSQRVRNVKLTELQKVIEALESQIDLLTRKLGSGGLRTHNLRRKGAYRDYGVRNR